MNRKNEARDFMIVNDAMTMPVIQIAKKYGVTKQRIYSIIDNAYYDPDQPMWWQQISVRMRNCILNEGYGPNDLEEIRFLGRKYWLGVPGIGEKTLREFETITGKLND